MLLFIWKENISGFFQLRVQRAKNAPDPDKAYDILNRVIVSVRGSLDKPKSQPSKM
tara:strand:- start:1039 stop:1206 length:168 start_codon:yes stop_codon:yes gene_type:complete